MDTSKIENIELEFLKVTDYEALKEATLQSYGGILNSYWEEKHIEKLISIFPEGQVVIKIDGQIAGCALSLIYSLHLGFRESKISLPKLTD